MISTDHSGIPELISDGKTGYIVPERDDDAIAEKCEYLIQHPDVCVRMGREASAFVQDQFDIERLNERLNEVFQTL